MQIKLTGQQDNFLFSDAFEILYGGAAGGGKSFALIIAAILQVHQPSYSAVLFRRTYPQLEGKGGLISISREIYPAQGGSYNETKHVWTFGSAHIAFGHMANKNDHYNYQGKEFHFVGFDELSHFEEDQYRYLFSRVRRRADSETRTRVLSATNPGSVWVKKRWGAWLDKQHPNPARPGELRWYKADGDGEIECQATDPDSWSRTFIPASFRDNPHLDQSYSRNLDLLPLVERRRLKDGDWDIMAGKGMVFSRHWFRTVKEFPPGIKLNRFWDLAATEKKLASDDPDYTATCLGGMHEKTFYIQFDRDRLSWAKVKDWMTRTAMQEQTVQIGIEQEPGATGKGANEDLIRLLATNGRSCKSIKPTRDKVTRAMPVSSLAEVGGVCIVENPHLPTDEILAELHGFPEWPHDDLVDAASGVFYMCNQSFDFKRYEAR